MFKKTKTTVPSGGGRVETKEIARQMHFSTIHEDMARERRALRNNTELGRVASVEHTMTTMVVLYASGTVVVTNWVAE